MFDGDTITTSAAIAVSSIASEVPLHAAPITPCAPCAITSLRLVKATAPSQPLSPSIKTTSWPFIPPAAFICCTARAAPSAIPGPNEAKSPDNGINDANTSGSLAGAAVVVVASSAGASVVSTTSSTASSDPPSDPPQAAAINAKTANKAKALRFLI